MRFFAVAPLIVLALGCATSPTQTTTSQTSKPASVGFYLVHEAPGEGLIEYRWDRTGETLFLSTTPDLTNADIRLAKVRLDMIKRRAVVLVHFTPVGSEKLATLTSRNIGKRMAIAVDRRIISVPLIHAAIRDGRATIQGFNSPDEAQRIADSLSRKR